MKPGARLDLAVRGLDDDALAVGDHFAVLIRGQLAANFRKGEKSREEITDLMAGGEDMAELEAQIAGEDIELHSPAHVRASATE